MAYEQKPGDIIVFKNKDKQGNQPDYRGNGLDLDGKKIELSLWIKDGAKGKFFAGQIKPEYKPDEKPDEPSELNQSSDGLPF